MLKPARPRQYAAREPLPRRLIGRMILTQLILIPSIRETDERRPSALVLSH